MSILFSICDVLGCNLSDIVEYTPKLPKEGLSQETIEESAGFDLIVHEIRK